MLKEFPPTSGHYRLIFTKTNDFKLVYFFTCTFYGTIELVKWAARLVDTTMLRSYDNKFKWV